MPTQVQILSPTYLFEPMVSLGDLSSNEFRFSIEIPNPVSPKITAYKKTSPNRTLSPIKRRTKLLIFNSDFIYFTTKGLLMRVISIKPTLEYIHQ